MTSGAAQAQRQIQDGITNMLEQLDKSCIRQMQGDMHRCAAKCCDDYKLTMEQTQDCIQRCQGPILAIQNYVHKEISNFQSRIERCVMDCQDKIRDQVSPGTSDDQMNKFREQFENCVKKCADTNCDQIPQLRKRLEESIKKQKFE